MKTFKIFRSITLLFILLFQNLFYSLNVKAAFDVQSVQLFRDNNICITMAGSTTSEGLDITTLQSNQESVQSRISSGGSLCPIPSFFPGGALLTTSGMTIQAQPNVQGFGRGIVISEVAGSSGGVSSSGDPSGFNTLLNNIGGTASTIFEISLPTGCDVVDDDDDIVGTSSDLTTINDFSFITCASTNGLTVQCNTASGLLTAANGLVAASSSSPAKVRFVISAINTLTDGNMIDSILLRLDSQDIFCPSTVSGTLNATIIAKNAIDNPTRSETIGTVSLGTPTQAVKISYSKDSTTSVKGEVSSNDVGTTPLLLGGSATGANKIQIEELHNEGIPIGGQSSAILINPSSTSTAENNIINLWLVPPVTNLFATAPSSDDISFSDNSFILHAPPYIVMSNSDDLNAPFGTLVIPVRKNPTGVDPTSVKTIITINNLVLSGAVSSSLEDPIISLALFELISGAIVNTPAGLSVNNSTNSVNPQNFSAFSTSSTRALAQNAVVGGAVNDPTAAAQLTTSSELSALTSRNTTLGTPQITGFTKIVSSVTQIDTGKVGVSTIAEEVVTSRDTALSAPRVIVPGANSALIIFGATGASIPGAKIKIDSIAKGSSTAFDSVTITSRSDGSFVAIVQADFSAGDVTVNFKQTVSSTDSPVASKTKTIPQGSISCDKTVCGCENIFCTPNITQVLDYVKNNGGLSGVISGGGDILQEVINAAKKALGLS